MPPKKQKSEKTLTNAQEEEMSSALIAQLLAEDGMDNDTGGYYAEYGNDRGVYDQFPRHDADDSYEEESEDDYRPKPGKRGRGGKRGGSSRGGGAPRGRKRKAIPSTAEVDDERPGTTDPVKQEISTTTEEISSDLAEKKEKKPKKAVAEGMRTGTYDADEEARFLEGLELFGREWTKLAAHIGTRDANSLRSHAQKHFIKLYRDNIPLPDKVKLTGLGYTLSGKELDPNSAAAKPYLARHSTENEKPPSTVQDSNNLVSVSTKDQDESRVQDLSVGVIDQSPLETKPTVTNNPPTIKKPKFTPNHARFQEAIYDEDGRTSYSKSRLRQPRERSSISYSQLNGDTDPLTMIKCEPFCGKPASGVAGCQPFEMKMHSNVLVAMDFHAHLMTTEVIGFLAGQWNKETKNMVVQAAYPCRSLNTGQNDVNVEMDPTSAIEVRQQIEDQHMQVVGWYHSHPTFVPDPSLMDIENQKSYQTQWRDEHTLEPFVGAILPGSVSVINWFYLDSDRIIPKRLTYDIEEDQGITVQESDRMFALLDEYVQSPERVRFSEFWRQDAQESKLQKLIKSLAKRMPWLQAALVEVMRRQQLPLANDAPPIVEPAPNHGVLLERDSLTGQDVVRELFLEQVEEKLKAW
ncbi:hypothetical protein INT44_006469 [Umbelopsis vinacea]|uniref:Myb-like, SWIRM and MPN domain-containing protein 1 n=1 Tax=Umbelopsis vinacea TaxID=44442 RepID=A0A8H7PT56_9FUNG|nr:hypothetical protein INT44_006469 [Umbelopsis vinacea]